MRAVLVFAFLAVITLPAAANLAGHDGADPYAENRELAALPRLHGATIPSLRTYSDEFSAWFDDDHFGFRSMLVRWSGAIRLFVHGVSPSRSVAKGEDGWFFYADDDAIEDFARVTPLTPEAVANWRTALLRTNGWLQARHVAYVFTIAPTSTCCIRIRCLRRYRSSAISRGPISS